MGPGLYAIWNTTMNLFYIGQSNCVPSRLASHWKDLEIGRHVCVELQQHWTSLGSQNFKFLSISVGPQWQEEQVRIDAENELVRLN